MDGVGHPIRKPGLGRVVCTHLDVRWTLKQLITGPLSLDGKDKKKMF